MAVDDDLTIPAYLLAPADGVVATRALLAIHGHGEVEAAIGLADDYHHCFALALAGRGHLVLCPELRGFGARRDLALHRVGASWWHGRVPALLRRLPALDGG